MGKTTLVNHWAQSLLRQAPDVFSDGRIMLDLHGHDDQDPMLVEDALQSLLLRLGLKHDQIPPEREERIALYRRETSDRDLLILLDNASDVEQVWDLVPGPMRGLVVVTSRHDLSPLQIRYGADYLPALEPLPLHASEKLLALFIGQSALNAERDAWHVILNYCGFSPLAISILGAQYSVGPKISAAELSAQLRSARDRLNYLSATDSPRASVRMVLDWSYKRLDPATSSALPLLALHPGNDIDKWAAAALLGTKDLPAERVLKRLVRVSLMRRSSPDAYIFYDLVRTYVQALATELPEDLRTSSISRLMLYWLQVSRTAIALVHPGSPTTHPVHEFTSVAPDLPTQDAASAWFARESANLWAAFTQLASSTKREDSDLVYRLSTCLWLYLEQIGDYRKLISLATLAAESARQHSRPLYEAHALNVLGAMLWRVGDVDQGMTVLNQALRIFEDNQDRNGVAYASGNLGEILGILNRYEEAESLYRRALETFDAGSDSRNAAITLNNIGNVLERVGRYRAALKEFRLALDRFGDDGVGRAMVLINIARVLMNLEEFGEARQALDNSISLSTQMQAPLFTASALIFRGFLNLAQPNQRTLDEALRDFEESLRLFGDAPDSEVLAKAKEGMGLIASHNGKLDEAVRLLSESLSVTRGKIELARSYISALNSLGEVYSKHHSAVQSRRAFREALELSRENKIDFELLRSLEGLAVLPTDLLDDNLSERYVEEAHALRIKLDLPSKWS